jgi:hypothetical protein
MSEYGIKEMDRTNLWVPPTPGEKPDLAWLEVRFMEFSGQTSK